MSPRSNSMVDATELNGVNLPGSGVPSQPNSPGRHEFASQASVVSTPGIPDLQRQNLKVALIKGESVVSQTTVLD